jgi:methylmalonyl-CoA/ethylmalonyl-CoA epimerase
MTESATEPQLLEVTQIAFTVLDLSQGKAFYQDVLGMKHLFDAGAMAFFQCGTVRLMLGQSEKPPGSEGTIVYFRVADLHATAARLEALGVAFVQDPHLVARMKSHDLWLAFIKDDSGNTLGLMGEVARS